MPTINSWNNQVLAANVTFNGGTMDIGTDNTTNAITIGTGTAGRTINIGLSAANNLLFLGTSNGSAATNIQAGSGNLILNSVGGTASLDATSGVSINSTAGTLNLGNSANSFAVNVGTAGTRTVTVGSLTSTSATTINAGSGSVTIGQNGGTGAVKIGNTTGNTAVLGTLTVSQAALTSNGTGGDINIANVSAAITWPVLSFLKSRSNAIITTGDQLGIIDFFGYDGTQYVSGAAITSTSSGTIAVNRVAANLVFATHPDSATGTTANIRMTIASTGAVTIATPDSGTGLTISGGGITSTGASSFSGGTFDVSTGTSAITISNDATNTSVSLGSGAGNKTVILGSTSGSSSLALKTGTSDFSLASATGTIISALDTGEITYPLQSSFLTYLNSDTSNDKTGDGTTYTVICDTEVFDQNSDYDNSTGTFTAPVTGRYFFQASVALANILVTDTGMTSGNSALVASNRTARLWNWSPFATRNALNALQANGSVLIDMDSADTVTFTTLVTLGGKTVGVFGLSGSIMRTYLSGQLLA